MYIIELKLHPTYEHLRAEKGSFAERMFGDNKPAYLSKKHISPGRRDSKDEKDSRWTSDPLKAATFGSLEIAELLIRNWNHTTFLYPIHDLDELMGNIWTKDF